MSNPNPRGNLPRGINPPQPAPANPPQNQPLPTSLPNDSRGGSITSVPEESIESVQAWKNDVYDVTDINEDMIKAFWEAFSYKGFNRIDVLKQIHKLVGTDKRLFMELVVVTALRGPQAASRMKLYTGKTPLEYGIPASGGQGTKNLTLNKIQAATADLAAYFLKRMNAPRRLNLPLPGWLQFPSAGGIKLPRELREQHIEFSKRFSSIIGGNFQEQIYMQMEANSYLDERLKLFE